MIDFICIGAQKSGTSWLYNVLYESEELYLPRKEIHFFSKNLCLKNVEWYDKLFSAKKSNQLAGEFSTTYLSSTSAPRLIYEYNPNCKFILILRNPVDRAISGLINDIKAGKINLNNKSANDFLDQNSTYINNGMYGKYLKKYLEYFPTKNFLILDYDDIKNRPLELISYVCEFLTIKKFDSNSTFKIINQQRIPRFNQIENLTIKIAEMLTLLGFHKLRFYIRNSGFPDFVRNWNKSNRNLQKIYIDRIKLHEIFVEDIELLSTLINFDVNKWK
jgi:hypothetical protein